MQKFNKQTPIMEKTEKEKTFKIIVVSLIFLGCFYQISHRFNGI